MNATLGIHGVNLKIWILFLALLTQSCAFLPTGPVSAGISDGYFFDGVSYKYQVALISKEASHSHSFTQFLFSVPHQDTETILTNSISGKVDAKSIVVISGYEKTKSQNWNEGYIEFNGTNVTVNLQVSRPDNLSKVNYMYNGIYPVSN